MSISQFSFVPNDIELYRNAAQLHIILIYLLILSFVIKRLIRKVSWETRKLIAIYLPFPCQGFTVFFL